MEDANAVVNIGYQKPEEGPGLVIEEIRLGVEKYKDHQSLFHGKISEAMEKGQRENNRNNQNNNRRNMMNDRRGGQFNGNNQNDQNNFNNNQNWNNNNNNRNNFSSNNLGCSIASDPFWVYPPLIYWTNPSDLLNSQKWGFQVLH